MDLDPVYMRALYLVLLLVVIFAGGRIRGRIPRGKAFEYVGIWIIIILVLMLGYQLFQTYRPLP